MNVLNLLVTTLLLNSLTLRCSNAAWLCGDRRPRPQEFEYECSSPVSHLVGIYMNTADVGIEKTIGLVESGGVRVRLYKPHPLHTVDFQKLRHAAQLWKHSWKHLPPKIARSKQELMTIEIAAGSANLVYQEASSCTVFSINEKDEHWRHRRRVVQNLTLFGQPFVENQPRARCGLFQVNGWVFEAFFPNAWPAPPGWVKCESPEYQPLCLAHFNNEKPTTPELMLRQDSCHDELKEVKISQRARPSPFGDQFKIVYGLQGPFSSNVGDEFKKMFHTCLTSCGEGRANCTGLNWTTIEINWAEYGLEMHAKLPPYRNKNSVGIVALQLVGICGRYSIYTDKIVYMEFGEKSECLHSSDALLKCSRANLLGSVVTSHHHSLSELVFNTCSSNNYSCKTLH